MEDDAAMGIAGIAISCIFFPLALWAGEVIPLWGALIPLGVLLVIVIGCGLFIGLSSAVDAQILRKNRRKDRAEEELKAAQKAREALVERALTQHVLLEMGLVDNRSDKIAKGTYGEYLPHQLDWPKEVA